MTKKGTLKFVPKSTPTPPGANKGLLQFKAAKAPVQPQRKTKGSRYA